MGGEPEIPYHDIGTVGKRPRIALVAGLAGQELNGTFALARLADYLRGVADGDYPDQRLRHRVLIIPAAMTAKATDHGDSAPSEQLPQAARAADGELPTAPEAEAQSLLEATRAAYYRVEIRGSGPEVEEVPQVRLYQCSDDERASAFLFGLPAIIEHPAHGLCSGSLVREWHRLGGENFILYAGQVGHLQLQHCERLFRALVSFLDRAEILEGVELSKEEEDTHHFGPHQTLPVFSEVAGFFVSCLEVGRWVRAGESVGTIYDPFLGTLVTDIRSPVNGLVSAIRRHPLFKAGELVARMQTHDSLPQGW